MLINEKNIEIIIKILTISFFSGLGLYLITALWDLLTERFIAMWIVDLALSLMIAPIIVVIIYIITEVIRS